MTAVPGPDATPGQAAYEAFRRWDADERRARTMALDFSESKFEAMRRAFIAGTETRPAAGQQPPALATVDLHRWYAVINQPDGTSKVIGHTDDGLGYYDSVDEWEAKNS